MGEVFAELAVLSGVLAFEPVAKVACDLDGRMGHT